MLEIECTRGLLEVTVVSLLPLRSSTLLEVAVEVGFPAVGFGRLMSGSDSSQQGGSDRFLFLGR